jgi:hypothetical protein
LNRPLRADLIGPHVISPVESPKSVGTDPGANHCDEYQRRCSLRRRGRSVAEGRMVHDLTQELGFLSDEPNGLRVRRGRGVYRQRLDLATGRDLVGEERS